MKKIKQFLGKLTVLSLSLSMMIIPNMSVHADTNPNTLLYLQDVDMNTGEMTNKTEQTLKDNYWVDLEKRNVRNVTVPKDQTDENMVGVFPKYITPPSNTAINSIVAFHGLKLDPLNHFPNTGIRSNGHTLEIAYYWSFTGSDYNQLPKEGWRNPYNFTEDKILTSDEIANPDEKLAVYGDLYAKGSNNSAEIDNYDKGSDIPLEFSLNASWFKRYLNGFTLEMFGGGGTTLQNIEKRAGQYAISDAGLAFTIDIPEGVVVNDNPTVQIEGLDGFSVKTSKEDGKLVIRLSKDEKAKNYKWKDLLEKISSVKADNIRVSISGVKVAGNATPDAQITLKGTVAGFYDFALSETEEFHSFSDNHTDDAANRLYTFFAAKQSDAGRDEAAPADKPNLISYTFKVNKPANNTVTFINDDAEYAKVKVETGKAIDKDGLTDESMPQNPTKSGYTFKEWNTQKDGKGTVFTGTTVVNQDMTVYAIYSKNAVGINEASKLEDIDKTSPKTGDSYNLGLYGILMGLSGLLLIAVGIRKRRKES